jgi:hypothetical protein
MSTFRRTGNVSRLKLEAIEHSRLIPKPCTGSRRGAARLRREGVTTAQVRLRSPEERRNGADMDVVDRSLAWFAWFASA